MFRCCWNVDDQLVEELIIGPPVFNDDFESKAASSQPSTAGRKLHMKIMKCLKQASSEAGLEVVHYGGCAAETQPIREQALRKIGSARRDSWKSEEKSALPSTAETVSLKVDYEAETLKIGSAQSFKLRTIKVVRRNGDLVEVETRDQKTYVISSPDPGLLFASLTLLADQCCALETG